MYHYNQPFSTAYPPRQPTIVFNHNNINSLPQAPLYRPTPYLQPSPQQNTTLQSFHHPNNLQLRNQQYRFQQRREPDRLTHQQVPSKSSKILNLGNQINNIQTNRPPVNSTRNYSEKKQEFRRQNFFNAKQSNTKKKQMEAQQIQEKQTMSTYEQLLQQNRGLKQIVDHQYLPMKNDVNRLIKQKQERDYLISELQWKLKELGRFLGNSTSSL